MHTLTDSLQRLYPVVTEHTYRKGDRVYDPFLVRYGTVQRILRDGRLEIAFDYGQTGDRRVMHHTEINMIHPADYPVERRHTIYKA